MAEHEPAIVARAWHDVTCPEGPDCRDRLLHSAAQPLAYTGVLAAFLERLEALEGDQETARLTGFRIDDVRRPTSAVTTTTLPPGVTVETWS